MNQEATLEQLPERETTHREWEDSEWFREWLEIIHREPVDEELMS